MIGNYPPDLSKAGSRQSRGVTRLALLLGGDVVDDLRFRLHWPKDLVDLFLRHFRPGEADAVELTSHVQRSINHLGLVGTKKVGDVIRGRLGGKAHDRIGAFARRAGKLGSARTALLFNHDCGNHGRLHQDRNGGGGCGPGKRARSKDRQKLRDAAAEVEPAAVARRPRLLGIARVDGAPSVSFRWIVSTSSSRTRSYCRASLRSRASACSTRLASRRLSVPAAYHGSRASIS